MKLSPLLLAVALIVFVLPGVAPAQTADTQTALHDELVSRRSDQSSATVTASGPLFAFYAGRNFEPAWTGSKRSEERAAMILDALAHAGEQGLVGADYAATATRWPEPPEPGAEAAKFELSLTADLLRYATDVCLGRLYPRDVYGDVSLPTRRFDIVAALSVAVKTDTVGALLSGLSPPHPEYRALIAALARYRAILALGGWPAVPGKGEVVLDVPGPRREALLARLSDDDPILAKSVAPSDDEIREALARFQLRNGMNPDGRAGPATLTELNKPVSQRVPQIVANLERWRWMPRDFESQYISVNVPDQSAQFVRDGEAVWTSSVVVGRPGSRTPILRMLATAVEVNPPWDVPNDIAAAQLLPQLRNSPNFLASHNMVLVDGPADDEQGKKINWRRVSATQFPYSVQQMPGPTSAMGVLMLDSPNAFGVYLHDTPGKALFDADMRQKSNGCVRVQQMFALSSLALTGDAVTGIDMLNDAVIAGQTQRLALSEPLPIYLLYWTAIADADGAVGFRPDFYGRDKPLLAALTSVSRSEALDQSPIAGDAREAGK